MLGPGLGPGYAPFLVTSSPTSQPPLCAVELVNSYCPVGVVSPGTGKSLLGMPVDPH